MFEGRDEGMGEEERREKGRRRKLTVSKSRSLQGSSTFDSTVCRLGRFRQLAYLVREWVYGLTRK